MNVWQKFKGWIAKKMNFTVETSPAMKEESFLEWLGVKRKNKDVMAEVTYFTCLKMMSETLAKIPWKYYQKTEKGIIEPELSDVAKLLKNRPNPFMTPTAFWNAVEMNRNHFGNAYVYVRSKFKRKKYGGESFRDIHIAKVTTNTETEYTAETPSKLARAITGKISDEFETEKIYSDDSVEDVNMSYKGTSVELEVNSLAPQDKSQVFGHLYEKGFLIKTKDDKAPELALGWRAKKLNGKYEFKWLYCGRFGQGFEDNYETEGETKTTQTATLKGDFYARQMDGRYECSVDESNLLAEHTEAAAAIKDWFSKVQEKPDAA